MKGQRVQLRAIRREDTEHILRLEQEFESRLLQRPGVPYPVVEQDVEKFVSEISSQNDRYTFGIETLDDQVFIGTCSIFRVELGHGNCWVSIMIGGPEHRGKGYGTEAMELLIDFIFRYINVHKIKLGVFSFNEQAIRSYEKNGFQVEGRMREELFREGKYHDMIYMGLLRREYEAIKERKKRGV
ncbi:hypothetical protein CIG75_05815 [Tumebacillus algifaecis]|uniref:N-acetyltransferase domain-containing protein n=1 Tax=Tumebacillus algifaecis TaxID=1214604 RepID=A0A223CYZ2_9BACL|nr:GNAT family protein [Tumebacillus algifaecis]ASS74561.1 hypothetical protein CIG75_05815 [Tumebacillus algifaecis]